MREWDYKIFMSFFGIVIILFSLNLQEVIPKIVGILLGGIVIWKSLK